MQIAGQYNWGQDGRFEFKGEALQLLGSTFASRPLLQFSSPCMFDQLFLLQFLHFFLSTCLQHFLPLSAGLMYSASSVFHAFSRDPLLPPININSLLTSLEVQNIFYCTGSVKSGLRVKCRWVFEICQKDTRQQCVRANDGKGGKAKMIVKLNCRRKRGKIGKKRGEIGRRRNYRMENRKQEPRPASWGNLEENVGRNKVGVKLLKEEDRQVITTWNGTLKFWGWETLKFCA